MGYFPYGMVDPFDVLHLFPRAKILESRNKQAADERPRTVAEFCGFIRRLCRKEKDEDHP